MAQSRNGNDHDVIIVGGGHNGLVASFYLAEAGLDVAVLERREKVGGAAYTEEIFPGYNMSTCSYVCWNLQEKVVEDMDLAGHGFVRHAIDPLPVLPLRDQQYLAFWEDDDRTREEIARISPKDAERFGEWLEFWERAASIVHPFFLRQPPTIEEIREQAAEIGELELFERLQTASIAELASEYFEDERVGAALVLICDIGDPYAPGSAWSEAWWHTNEPNGSVPSVVEGGMGGITQAMAKAAIEQGVVIKTESEVEKILVEDGRATGVRLVGGEELSAATVVSNADPKRTFLKLVDAADIDAGFRSQIEGLSTKAACLKFHAVLDEPLDLSPYLGPDHDPRYSTYVTLAPDGFETYRRAWDQAQAGEIPGEPVCHIQVPTAYDKTLTQGEGEIVSIWTLYAPSKPSAGSWDELREQTAESLIDYVATFIPNFRSAMRQWELLTPMDIEERVGITDGCIRHIDLIPGQLYGDRPLPGSGYRTPIEGLWLCGVGTHPGGEVTGAPGHNAARALLAKLGIASGEKQPA
ncbi:MAG: NAD(P)/FAD-dependent oxidoreductase [Solirubrobacterales bacterium]|nr:NAD(P)/FAD-dependent oxidoreductase [Solirubrobacterales bacterium]